MFSYNFAKVAHILPWLGVAISGRIAPHRNGQFRVPFRPSLHGHDFGPEFGPFVFAISYRVGPLCGVRRDTRDFLQFGNASNKLPPLEEAIIRTAVGNRNAPFLVSFTPPPAGLIWPGICRVLLCD